jgi:hypothetical protein
MHRAFDLPAVGTLAGNEVSPIHADDSPARREAKATFGMVESPHSSRMSDASEAGWMD